jgi:hypothetical protein
VPPRRGEAAARLKEASVEAAVKGSVPVVAAHGAPAVAGPRGAHPPCPPSSLDILSVVDEPSPLVMSAKGEAIS